MFNQKNFIISVLLGPQARFSLIAGEYPDKVLLEKDLSWDFFQDFENQTIILNF